MKKSYLLIMSLFCVCLIHAQQPTLYSFSKEIELNTIDPQKFYFEIAVHSNNAAPEYAVRSEIFAVYASGEQVKLSSLSEWRREQDWEILSVAASSLQGTKKIIIVTSILNKGEFFFDDLSFYLEESKGKWNQLTLRNPSFEESTIGIPGYDVGQAAFARISRHVAKVGKHSLMVNLARGLNQHISTITE